MTVLDPGRQSSFRWPLTAYVSQPDDGPQVFGLADLSTPGASIETDTPVEVRR